MTKIIAVCFIVLRLVGCSSIKNNNWNSSPLEATICSIARIAGVLVFENNKEKICNVLADLDRIEDGDIMAIGIKTAMPYLQKKYGIGSELATVFPLLINELARTEDEDMYQEALQVFRDAIESSMDEIGISCDGAETELMPEPTDWMMILDGNKCQEI